MPQLAPPLHALLAQSPFATAVYDAEGRFVMANAAYEHFWNVRAGDIPPDWSLFTDPQLAREGVVLFLRRAYAGEHVVVPPVRYDATVATGAAGRAAWSQAHCYPIRDASDAVTHVAITYIDVTATVGAERAAVSARSRLERIVERLPAPTAIVAGPDLVFVAANHAYRRLVGARTIVGRAFAQALPELAEQGFLKRLARVRDGGRAERGEAVRIRWDRYGRGEVSEAVVDFIYEPLPASDEDPAGVIIQVIDRTEREQATRRAEQLLALVSRLNEALTRAEVADATLAAGLAAVGADAGSLALVRHDASGAPTGFEVVRAAGPGAEEVARYRESPLARGRPLSDAVLERRIVALGSRPECEAGYAASAPEFARLPFHAFVAVPAAVGDQVVAALALAFRTPQTFDEGTRTFLATLGEQCAMALERARLHESELRLAERHAALLETIQDAFVAIDRETRYTYVNARFEELSGRSVMALIGRRIDEVSPEAVGTPVHDAILETLATGRGRSVEAFSAVARRWVEARLYPAPDGLSLVMQDVTERRRAQEAAAIVADTSRALGASLDYEATLQAVANAVVPRLGDWCAVDLVRDPTAGHWPPRLDRVAVRHEDPATLALGAELVARYPPDWGEPGGVAGVLRDRAPLFVPEVTDAMLVAGARDAEHLRLLRALRFSSIIVAPLVARDLTLGMLTLCMTESGRHYDAQDVALAQDIAHRAAVAVDNARLFRDAERARAEAEAASRAKSQFLATMSHELRTPLNAIGGYAELIAMGIRGPVNAQQVEDLERIQRSQRHLLGLINEVLNYARLETGSVRYDIAVVGVAGVLAAVESLILPQVRQRALALAMPGAAPDLLVRADAEKVRQILLNLLSNAVKFTDPGGRVAIACEAGTDPARGRVVRVAVSDSGVGIPADKLEAIFEPFVQVGRALNNPGEGTGLGLAISRDLARGMGGELRVSSVVGEGSTFTLELPAA